MTETLTESFCERCGTRYTFESAGPRKGRLSRVRTLSKGLRNYVLSDETTLSEAMADARSQEDLASTMEQLDAFHRTFNFCLGCRQYTCATCWNGPEGRCLSCAPHLGDEILPAPFPDLDPAAALDAALGRNGQSPAVDLAAAWPAVDLPTDRLARALDEEEAELPPAASRTGPDARGAESSSPAETSRAPDPAMGGSMVEPGPDAEAPSQPVSRGAIPPPAPIEPAAGQPRAEPFRAGGRTPTPGAGELASRTRDLLGRFRPGESLEAAIAAYEAEAALGPSSTEPDTQGTTAPLSEAEGRAGTSDLVASLATAEPEPAARAEPVTAEPEPVTAEPEPRPDDQVQQPTWPVPAASPPGPGPTDATRPAAAPVPWLTVAPDLPVAPSAGSPSPGRGTEPPGPETPRWPEVPQWPAPGSRPAPPPGGSVWQPSARAAEAPRMLAGRPLVDTDPAGVWAASNLEVLGSGAGGPASGPRQSPVPQSRACVNCGLALSATARFCRRCGTAQG